MSRRGHPNFTNPSRIGPLKKSPTSFDSLIAELGMSAQECTSSPDVRQWVIRNKDDKYVPIEILEAFGLSAED